MGNQILCLASNCTNECDPIEQRQPLFDEGVINDRNQTNGKTLLALHLGGTSQIRSTENVTVWTKVSAFADWIQCINKNANEKSHSDVEKDCIALADSPKCDQTALFPANKVPEGC